MLPQGKQGLVSETGSPPAKQSMKMTCLGFLIEGRTWGNNPSRKSSFKVKRRKKRKH